MCTFVILRRSNHAWPVLIAANRDELYSREFEKPDRHWLETPDIIGGWDSVAHGSWFAINDYGMAAAILNRVNSTGSNPHKRSRGELVIESLTHADASAAAESLAMIDPAAYAPFNLVIADNTFACWLKNDGHRIEVAQIPEGYSMLTTHDRNDYSMPRIRNYLPRFQTAKIPDPESNDWRDWQVLMGQRLYAANDGPYSAMCIIDEANQYGTVCSQLLAIPHVDRRIKPVFLFANGRPGEAPFEMVEL